MHKSWAVDITARALLLRLTLTSGDISVRPIQNRFNVTCTGYPILERRIAFEVALFFVELVGCSAAVKACRLAGFRASCSLLTQSGQPARKPIP